MFGGFDLVTDLGGYTDAFASSFTHKKNREAWEKVGAAPLTMACLKSAKVNHNCETDPNQETYRAIDERNKLACALLQNKGLHGEGFRLKLSEAAIAKPLTIGHSEDRYKQLAMATTHGERFFVTGGDHACTDDVFKAFEYKDRLQKIAELKKERKARLEMEAIDMRANDILHTKKPPELMNIVQLRIVLRFFGVPKKDVGGKRKSELVRHFKEIAADGRKPMAYD